MAAWPEAVSDGLTIPCQVCGILPKFDYLVEDDLWRSVAPKEYLRSVICLPCLDRIASAKGIDVSAGLLEVQFTGIGKTVILKPEWTHRYTPKRSNT